MAGYIQYERIYYKDGKAEATANKGAIIEKEFTLGLYPSIKYADGVKPYYKVAFLDRDSVDNPDSHIRYHSRLLKQRDVC